MSRIAIVDLSFTWPPDGGARTDIREVGLRLAEKHEVKMFVPKLKGWLGFGRHWLRFPLDRTRFFWKGQVNGDVGFPVETVPFGPISFGAKSIGPRIKAAVDAWGAEKVFIADGWYLKPYVIEALQDYEPVVRIYAHEMLCLKGNGFFFRKGKVCTRDYLAGGPAEHKKCTLCTLGFYASYPSPTWIHEFMSSRAWSANYPALVKESLAKAGELIVYNSFTADRIKAYNPKTHVVPSGVTMEDFLKIKTKAPSKKTIILSIGRMEEKRKGLAVLLKACEKLGARGHDFELWVTGQGLSNHPWVKHLGWQSPKELLQTYAQADICVVPSLWPEPQGIVAIEAMAAGKPAVVSSIGGLKETNTHAATGFQFEAGDHEQLFEILKKLIKNPELGEKVGMQGRKAVKYKYDWDTIVSQQIEPLFH